MAGSFQIINIKETIYLNCLLFAAFVVQLLVFYDCFQKQSDLYPFYYVAIVSSISIIVFTIWRGMRKVDIQNHVLSCILVSFLFSLGCFIAMLSNTFHFIFSHKFKENFADWLFNYLFATDAKEKSADQLYNRIVSGLEQQQSEIDTEPLVDVMDFGTLEQKQAALIKVVKYFRPHLAQIIKMGLNDSNNAIRIQAAAGLARLQDSFHKKYAMYERKINENCANMDDLVHFARICEDYSLAKILDPKRNEEVIERSIIIYERCIKEDSNNLDLKLSLIKVLMIKKDVARASELLSEIIPLSRKWSPRMAAVLLDFLFQMGRFAELRVYAEQWKGSTVEGIMSPLDERIALWNGNLDEQNMEILQK